MKLILQFEIFGQLIEYTYVSDYQNFSEAILDLRSKRHVIIDNICLILDNNKLVAIKKLE